MSTWKWAVAGLVAAAMLLGIGWWTGHRGATLSDPERQALVARNDSLRAVHDSTVAVLAARAAAAQDSARRMAERAQQAEAGRADADAAADSLAGVTAAIGAELATAQTLADSFGIRTRELAARTAEFGQAQRQVLDERAIAASWKATYLKQLEATADLQARIVVDSTRIVELDATVDDLSKPGRLEFNLLGFRSQCGPGVTFTSDRQVRPAIIACVVKL